MAGMKNVYFKIKNSKWKGLYAGMMAGVLLIIFQIIQGSLNIALILGVSTGCLISYIINLKYIEHKSSKNGTNYNS
ncbi:hypothetical protein [Alkalibacillus haloalkaliphilus]|uniref:hypothetical protein n=1 Tax=Alkalibacillus haloalkaliphilus TaxID=94136 RepID=UPI0029362E8E|nr:hypothetical protein [Alkalibacillus haloalkaliphilus]MDV2581583.1 hypothetical protein [Alkalibacillus haloalkaliphilus]